MPATNRMSTVSADHTNGSYGARVKEERSSWGSAADEEGPCSMTSPLQSPREPTRSPSILSIGQGFWSFSCRRGV